MASVTGHRSAATAASSTTSVNDTHSPNTHTGRPSDGTTTAVTEAEAAAAVQHTFEDAFPPTKQGSAQRRQYNCRKWAAFILTFFAYTSFHLSRKPSSIVKNVLHPSSPDGQSTWNPVTHPGWAPFNQDLVPATVAKHGFAVIGGGDSSIDGLYQCANFTATGDCAVYTLPSGTGKGAMLRVNPKGPRGLQVHPPELVKCWELLSPTGRLLYYQRLTDDSHGACPLLPLITTPSHQKFWEPMPGVPGPGPAVMPNLTNGKILLGSLDTVFLVCYAIGLFIAGHIGDHVNIRWFLTIGMTGSGLLVAAQGLGYYLKMHSFWYYAGMYAVQGFFQAIGWPSVVAVVGSWWGQRTRGGAMGIWNAHTSCGNIFGSLVSVAALRIGMGGNDWPAAFFLPGGIIFVMGIIIAIGLVAHPHDLHLPSPNDTEREAAAILAKHPLSNPTAAGAAVATTTTTSVDESTTMATNGSSSHTPLLNGRGGRGSDSSALEALTTYGTGNGTQASHSSTVAATRHKAPKATRGGCSSFIRALCIPGVIQFAMALFFAKLVAYAFIYWLPLYLAHISYSTDEAGRLSTFFDLGGIVGGITAGFLSDRLKMRAVVAFIYLILAVPGLYFYRVLTLDVGSSSTGLNILFMLVCGAIVNGPYALITTAVSADLGTHKSLQGDSKLLASVTGIIDGTGSAGAALQGVLISWISSKYSWTAVFYALIVCSVLSAILLIQLVWKELKAKWNGEDLFDAASNATGAGVKAPMMLSPGIGAPGVFRGTASRPTRPAAHRASSIDVA